MVKIFFLDYYLETTSELPQVYIFLQNLNLFDHAPGHPNIAPVP